MLEANEISCSRGNRRLFSRLSFRIASGTALRIHGVNGAGKTSLLRMLAGLSPTADGRIAWCGQPLAELGDDYSKQIIFVGHTNGLKAYLSPCENIRLGLSVLGISVTDAAVRGALEDEGLGSIADIPVQRLSAGQQRRTALTRIAFAGERKLWVLDEPFSSLDDAAVARLSTRIARHLTGGGIVAYTTHQDVAIDAPQSLLELG